MCPRLNACTKPHKQATANVEFDKVHIQVSETIHQLTRTRRFTVERLSVLILCSAQFTGHEGCVSV